MRVRECDDQSFPVHGYVSVWWLRFVCCTGCPQSVGCLSFSRHVALMRVGLVNSCVKEVFPINRDNDDNSFNKDPVFVVRTT